MHRRRESVAGYLFILPALILFVGFLGYPLLHSLYLSLTKYNFVYSKAPTWVGLNNYVQMFGDPGFQVALLHTGQFTLMFLPALLLLGLGIASLIQARAVGGAVLQGVIFLPVVVPLSIAGVMFIWLYSDSFGLVNFLLSRVGLGSMGRAWLNTPETALPAIALVNLWKYTGLSVVLFLAGLAAIPSELYEAARIDGANSFQLLTRITIPNLKETFVLVTIWGLIEAWKVFALPFVMTKGGPGDATQVLYLYIYQTAFKYFEVGKASAMAFFLAFIIIVFSLLTIRLARTERQ
jgi:multiple sugar transport system permease protein